MEKVLDFIKNNTNLNPNDYVVIGVSGGPDSMFLLQHLIMYRSKVHINIVCAHVHHNLREESDEEALYVEEYCRKNNIIFEMTKLDCDKTNFSEALGHEMRYQYFDAIVNKYGAKYLFTAHHGDDLVETVLMRLVRGSSFIGYAGFNSVVKSKRYKILRPLVSLTKKEILDYLQEYNIHYVIDKSNNDDTYTRNRYRKYILPKLKEEDANVHLKFLKYNQLLNEYNDFVEDYVDSIYDTIVQNNVISVTELKRQNSIIIKSIISKWLYSVYKDTIKLVGMKHINNIISIMNSSKANLVISIPNYSVVKSYDKIYIKKLNNGDDYEYILSDSVDLPNGKTISFITNTSLTNNYVTHLNSCELNLPLYVRNFHTGDKMTIKNMNGHKKIKDIFINEKVDRQIRYSYPVVVDSNGEIIWLPGIKKSAFDSQKTGKYDIILEYH